MTTLKAIMKKLQGMIGLHRYHAESVSFHNLKKIHEETIFASTPAINNINNINNGNGDNNNNNNNSIDNNISSIFSSDGTYGSYFLMKVGFMLHVSMR